MAIGIDDLYDDDLIEDQLENQNGEQFFNQEPPANVSSGEQIEDDVLQSFLRTKGIDDPSRIKFEDENGNLQERSWDSLDSQEKLNILNTPVQQNTVQEPINNVDNQLQDDEIDLINSIRNSGLSPQDFIQSIIDNQNNSEPIYQVDDLSDDEIYILDLESRVGELSEDEAVQALTMAKQNEEFYKKQIEGIRKEYKEREDFKKEQEQNQLEQQQQEAYEQYSLDVINAIDNFNSVGNLDLNLEDADKEDLANFMLNLDNDGTNYLYKELQNPETLVKAAWFILNGEQAFDSISDYFVNQIRLVSENQYKKGLEDGKNGKSSKPNVVISKNNNPQKQYKTIDDLDYED